MMTGISIHPEGWAPASGYSNGMLFPDGTLHVAGQIGWDKDKQFVSDDFVSQMEQALRNILEIVTTAGGTAQSIGRLTWFVTDKSDYLARQKEVGQAYRRVLGAHFPAMSMLVVAGLVEDRALVEIEATAFIPPA